MSKVKFCRICLNVNVRMYLISGSEVQDVYEKLTDIKVTSDQSVGYACYLCYHQLKKCRDFVIRSRKAEQLLCEILENGIELDHDSICLIDRHSSGLVSLVTVAPDRFLLPECGDVKIETQAKCESNNIDVKNEPEDFETSIRDECSEPHASDSEDDLPLKSISSRKTLDRRVNIKKKARVKRQTQKDCKVDASEIILSKEQQLEQLFERSKSLNYISSPFKCEMCYKGFLEVRAYENHKRKHDVRSGPYECDVCRMRYRSARLLRTHAAAAHARLYRCNKCTHTAHTLNQAREHEKWHNGHTYECQLCGQKFRKPTSYLTHKRKHHPTEHVCYLCGESFVGRHGLLMHKSKTHKWDLQTPVDVEPNSESFCVECDVQFASMEAWKRHILTSIKHTLGSDGSQCKICHVRVSGESMSSHMRGHEKSLRQTPIVARKLVKLACEQCDAFFVGGSNLRAHVRRVHLGLKYNKNVVCEVCGKKCTSNASLRYHQRAHTGERPFPCAACPKRFSDNNQLRLHTRTHTGERPYCCAACPKRFSQKAALNRHARVHTGVKPYECQFCSKTFNQSNSMQLHVKTVHLKLPPNRRKTTTIEKNVDVPTVDN